MMSSAGAAPVQLQKRAGGSTDPLFNLSENISSQLQIALQPKLRQFSNNVHRNIFAGILPHDNEFVVTFGERSGMKTEISQAITSTWAKEQADMRKAVLDAIKQDLEHERQTIQDLNVAARRAREAVVKKIQGSVKAHIYDTLISEKVQPLLASAIGKSYTTEIGERIAKNIEGVTNLWLERTIMNGFCVDAECIDSQSLNLEQ
ncbi:hypothetical protein VKS41_000902 [Umbelopsis sp. WA50703]